MLLAFMTSPLASSGAAGADQPGARASFNMADYQEPLTRRVPDRNMAILVVRVIGIAEGRSHRIVEHGHGFVERHAVLLEVRGGLVGIPLETHSPVLTYVVSSGCLAVAI